jgi:hypothetical protein
MKGVPMHEPEHADAAVPPTLEYLGKTATTTRTCKLGVALVLALIGAMGPHPTCVSDFFPAALSTMKPA